MLRTWQSLPPLVLLLIATVLEVSGDAIVRKALYAHAAAARLGLFLLGGLLLLCYGTALNLAPLEFNRVVGLYLATFFVVWQVIGYLVFRAVPTLPILVGGALIIIGGLVVTLWQPA